MKILLISTLVILISSCSHSTTSQAQIDEKVKKIQSSAWYQRVERR
jgi:hypothetical protein